MRKLPHTKLCHWNLMKGINTLCKVLWTILKMDKGETQTNGPKNKEIDNDALGLTSERWHRLYVSRKGEGRGLISIEDCVDASIKWLKEQRKTNYSSQKQHWQCKTWQKNNRNEEREMGRKRNVWKFQMSNW